MINPDKIHWKALERIWKYLNKYPNLGLFYNCNDDIFVKIYTDSDWASNLDDRKSTKAYISFIGNNPINWKTKLQKIIVYLSIETEYMILNANT